MSIYHPPSEHTEVPGENFEVSTFFQASYLLHHQSAAAAAAAAAAVAAANGNHRESPPRNGTPNRFNLR